MEHCPNCDTDYQVDRRFEVEEDYCGNCGKLLDSGFINFCANCGCPVDIGISVTKSGFYKISPYREYVVGLPLEKWFEEVEKALGFKLFFWQKTFIAHGAFRCYGKTTAEILRDLSQTQHRPLDLRKYKSRPMRERMYYGELLKIKAALDAAGVPTREVWLCEKDRREWAKKWEEDHAPAEAELRPLGKFWDV